MGEHKRILKHLLDSSEMACSLRFEDMRGCPYNIFDKRSIFALASSCAVLAFVSLIPFA